MKKLLLFLLVFTLVFSWMPLTKAANVGFKDVPKSHPNYTEIMYLLEKGVIAPADKFGVNEKVTREETATWIARAIKLDGTKTKTKFKDVPESRSSSGYINSAVKAGILNGYPDGTFKPTQPVTRGHMAVFVTNAFKFTHEADVTFTDVPKGSTSYNSVRRLATANITSGYPDRTFKPNATLTRAHFAAFLARAMEPSFRPANNDILDETISSMIPKPNNSTPPVAKEFGSVKGAITWQYNNFIGTKPDVGAKVFLIPTDYKVENDWDFGIYASIGSIPKGSNLHFAKVNGFGYYEITDVPVGEYLIIVSSKNTTRNFNEEIILSDILKPMMSSTAYDDFELFNLKLYKHDWGIITIQKDKTIDVSHDFGFTWI